MKESKSLSGFEPTAVRGKWFEVNDLNHLATDKNVLKTEFYIRQQALML
jgi:hypothetical protein